MYNGKGIYRGYKGGLYLVLGLSKDSDNIGLNKVVYYSLYDGDKFPKFTLWERDARKFNNITDDKKERYVKLTKKEILKSITEIIRG